MSNKEGEAMGGTTVKGKRVKQCRDELDLGSEGCLYCILGRGHDGPHHGIYDMAKVTWERPPAPQEVAAGVEVDERG